MKTNKIFIILLLCVFCQCTKSDRPTIIGENLEFGLTLYSDACFPEVNDKYEYPVVPGMEEWNNLDYDIETPWEKFCQLPDSVLKTISTAGLIDALIYAPLFTGFSMISSDGTALKWHRHYGAFNSAKELFQRENADDALVAYYELVRLNCIKSSSKDTERMEGLEMLFTKQQILDKMGHESKKQAIVALLANYKKFPDDLNRIFPMAFIMYADKYEPIVKYSQDNEKEFNCILNGYFYSFDQADLITSYAENYIK